MVQKSELYVPIPAGLYASNRDERFHFQSHSLPGWGAFSWGKGYPAAASFGLNIDFRQRLWSPERMVIASGMITAYNRRSGGAEPSEVDRLLTQDLIAIFQPLGLKVLDHVIDGDETTFPLRK
jgi:RadC-like JAB domain